MAELTRRYVVMTMATEAPFDPLDPEGVFVLKPWKDPAALRALAAYRDNCYPELARDLDAWISSIETGSAVRGDVGRRNEAFVQVIATAADAGDDGGASRRAAGRSPKRPAKGRAARAKAGATARRGTKSKTGAKSKSRVRTASAKRKKRGR
jgi:hypothetical protein